MIGSSIDFQQEKIPPPDGSAKYNCNNEGKSEQVMVRASEVNKDKDNFHQVLPIVVVGSTNPVKLKAVESALKKTFRSTSFVIEGINVDSNVSSQPMSDSTTRQGAINRAVNAANAYEKVHQCLPMYAVGLEGGCAEEKLHPDMPDSLLCFAWMAVYHPKQNKWGISKSAAFPLPTVISNYVRGGMELGHADDHVFQRQDSKKKDGSLAVGILTNGLIERALYYEHALILALVPFSNPDYY